MKALWQGAVRAITRLEMALFVWLYKRLSKRNSAPRPLRRALRSGTQTFQVLMYQDEDGVWIAEVPALPGCVSQGETPDEAERNVRDAIRECLIVRAEMGMPPASETRQVEVCV